MPHVSDVDAVKSKVIQPTLDLMFKRKNTSASNQPHKRSCHDIQQYHKKNQSHNAT